MVNMAIWEDRSSPAAAPWPEARHSLVYANGFSLSNHRLIGIRRGFTESKWLGAPSRGTRGGALVSPPTRDQGSLGQGGLTVYSSHTQTNASSRNEEENESWAGVKIYVSNHTWFICFLIRITVVYLVQVTKYRFQNGNASLSVKQVLKDRRKMKLFWRKRSQSREGKVIDLIFLRSLRMYVNEEKKYLENYYFNLYIYLKNHCGNKMALP